MLYLGFLNIVQNARYFILYFTYIHFTYLYYTNNSSKLFFKLGEGFAYNTQDKIESTLRKNPLKNIES